MKYKKILFVCTGNTCRSPMAEIILKNKLKNAGVEGVRVKSAGLNTEDGLKMSQNSFQALKLLGYKPYGFKSRQLTPDMIKKADLVLTMTYSHKLSLRGFNNVYTIAEATGLDDVLDPYGGNMNEYIKTSHQLEDACNVILNEILIRKGEK